MFMPVTTTLRRVRPSWYRLDCQTPDRTGVFFGSSRADVRVRCIEWLRQNPDNNTLRVRR